MNTNNPERTIDELVSQDHTRAGDRSLQETAVSCGCCPKALDDVLQLAWLEILCAAKHKRLSHAAVTALAYRHLGLTAEDIAAEFTTEAQLWTSEQIESLLEDSAKRISSIPAFGLWSVLAEVFHLKVGAIRTLIMITRDDDD